VSKHVTRTSGVFPISSTSPFAAFTRRAYPSAAGNRSRRATKPLETPAIVWIM
jgi:hypothetical protein